VGWYVAGHTVLRALVLCLLGLAACDPPRGPALVKVTGVGSSELREGDTLELRGQSFPEGRSVEVTLRGEVRRAGQERTRGFELTLTGTSASTHSVTIPVTRQVERAFTGVERAAHTTFRGAIEVSFRPRVAGTPPVTGELPEAVLDFLPAEEDAATSQELAEQGQRFAAFAGLLLGERGGQVVVEGVMPDSPAERAGVGAGDRLLEIDGLRVLAPPDLVPPPRARASELWVERAAGAGRARLVADVAGFEPLSARDLAPVAGVIAAIAFFLALLVSPFGRVAAFFESRVAERLRALTMPRPPRPRASGAGRAPLATLMAALPLSVAPYVAVVAASALVTALGLGRSLVAREVDLAVVLIGVYTALAVTVLIFGARGERGALPRLKRVLLVLVQGVVAAAAFGAAAVEAGGLGVLDFGLAQGAAPWHWLAVRGPLELGATAVLVLSLVPEASHGPPPVGTSVPSKRRRTGGLALVSTAHLVVMSGLVALVFLGGARLSAFGAPSLGGVALLLAKTALVMALLVAIRRLLGPFDLADARAPLCFIALPGALVLFGLSLAARRFLDGSLVGAFERATALGFFALALVAAVLVVSRTVLGLKARGADPGLNPWI